VNSRGDGKNGETKRNNGSRRRDLEKQNMRLEKNGSTRVEDKEIQEIQNKNRDNEEIQEENRRI
jgi:hypothetical protein